MIWEFVLNNAWSLGGGGIAAVGLFWAGHRFGSNVANVGTRIKAVIDSIRNLGKKPG